MLVVTISMFYVINSCILHHALPKSLLSWEVCYIYFLFRSDYSTSPELYMCWYLYVYASYNGVWIYMFVYGIQYNCWLYLILGIFYDISPMCGLFFHCIFVTFAFLLICLWMLYIFLLVYVDVFHTICSLVVLDIGNLVMHISCIWFVMPFSPFSLACIHKSWLTSLCLN